MSGRFEYIINLMNFGNHDNSSTLEQHCSAMRMDDSYSWAFNRLISPRADAEADVERLAKADPIADLDELIAEVGRAAASAEQWWPRHDYDYDDWYDVPPRYRPWRI